MKQEFEKWVLDNHKGEKLEKPPSDWNQEKEFFYKINEFQHRIHFQEVPQKFRKALGIPSKLPTRNR